MAKYVRYTNNQGDDEMLKKDGIYKAEEVNELSYKISRAPSISIYRFKERFEEVEAILDIDLQRVNNIVIGTSKYVSDEFEGTEKIRLAVATDGDRTIFLYDNDMVIKKHKGLSDTIHFDSTQEAQDYIDKFTKIIDDININHRNNKPKYKINSDRLYTEYEIVKMKELGIDFVEVK